MKHRTNKRKWFYMLRFLNWKTCETMKISRKTMRLQITLSDLVIRRFMEDVRIFMVDVGISGRIRGKRVLIL